MIDKSKQYKTADGREVRIYGTDGAGAYPVHGAINTHDEGWLLYCWPSNGCAKFNEPWNLVEVKPRIEMECWLNVHDDYVSGGFLTKDEANLYQGDTRIACVKVVIDCEEGSGLGD